MKTGYYARHTLGLRQDLAASLDRTLLKALHRKNSLRHFLVAGRQYLLLGTGVLGIVLFHKSQWWIPFATLVGLTVFNFTVLLHEVLHGLVFRRRRPRACAVLALIYALPAGISPLQFTRWHLDHHAELGSWDGDPKRHYLSPRVNRRWYKALYFTPALFFLYFRAAARETASYPPDIQARIARERVGSTVFQILAMSAAWLLGGWGILLRAYIIPVFFVFPVAFALNRLGQHYDIRPEDPAQWSTLVKPSWFWDRAFLWSNYHLEHHYFPGVPFYNLPRLHRLLAPFFAERGIRPRSYTHLLFQYLVQNKAPHTDWSLP